jgi:hypothetical protein
LDNQASRYQSLLGTVAITGMTCACTIVPESDRRIPKPISPNVDSGAVKTVIAILPLALETLNASTAMKVFRQRLTGRSVVSVELSRFRDKLILARPTITQVLMSQAFRHTLQITIPVIRVYKTRKTPNTCKSVC